MKHTNNFLKSITIITIGILIISVIKQGNLNNIKDIMQTNLYQGLRTVKVTEEKTKIDSKNTSISIKMPEIHYQNEEVERYINTYIRKSINEFVNHQRQIGELSKEKKKRDISINYHVVFEDCNLINIVIYRNINEKQKDVKLEKDSYIFDLKTGQRVYIDNFLKDNSDYDEVIKNYIDKYIDKNKSNIDKEKININKYTNYIITDGGISVYFNPYKDSKEKAIYEFKIPYEIFKNKIKIIETDDIVANVDTQTITKNNKYINSVINIPIIMTSNKDIDYSINEKIRNDIMKFYDLSQKEAEDYFKGIPDEQNKFVANADFEVKKNSDDMLSIMVKYYKYSGGAHGYSEDITYNIDIKNGKILMLSDLFKEKSNYKKVIDNEIRKQIEDLAKKDPETKGVYQFEGIKDNQKFYIQDDNLVIYFDLYEIAPYAAGMPEYPININIINHILKDEYINIFK
ncbi:DUF3298 domain-containing protein [[Clostridium] dakarense]|uniref:DUF3298 domain-containing protein n=1 Tax=Faecalimicrobium dakarense TaxID=1301100 RepID=UPI0004B04C56|nr:DUF3298 domain-containing protein [[Clostridium] dakarense]